MLHNVPVSPTMFKNRYVLGYPDDPIRRAMVQTTHPGFFELICHGSRPNQKGENVCDPICVYGKRRLSNKNR